jgi:hypothetical protein
VEANDVGEERIGDGFCSVWVSKRYKVTVLAEPVHHGEYDGLPADFRKGFYEVQSDVGPY